MRLLNHKIIGWVLFLSSAILYAVTAEPTASFWDCGEFIAASYKLQIPHPPGPPVFLLLGRLFSMFASDSSNIAFAVNMLSVLSSAATIAFMYWTVVLLAGKVTRDRLAQIMAGMISSVSFAFTDTFWFSATEAEVYSLSLMFMVISLWAILRWEQIEDDARANRWLIFVAYLIGLSVAVHPLSLLTIPSIGLVIYSRYFKWSVKGVLLTLLVSSIGILVMMYGFRVGIISIITHFEMFFVNTLNFPFWIGASIGGIAIITSLAYLIWFTHSRYALHYNTLLLSFAFIVIGYSSYGLVLIRSAKNPMIDMNNPENLPNFIFYLDMLQYGTRPLLYGEHFNSEVTGQKPSRVLYRKGDTQYEVMDEMVEYEYSPKDLNVFPRMYSTRPEHKDLYRNVVGLKQGEDPSLSDNIYYFLKHQLGNQYLRYFLWNFAGRASDIQGASWLSPLSPDDNLPFEVQINEGRNNYWMLPLCLGILGLLFHGYKSKEGFAPVAVLFLMTGVGLVTYINAPPMEPRERDYIYVGSYYAFALWLGFGFLAIRHLLLAYLKKTSLGLAIATTLSLTIPIVLGLKNFTDHDRSGRYYSRDSAINHLASCAENAILLTGGDNDTYPLWYVQDVENYRTDVRVIVSTLFNTEWNIDQMLRSAYESEPLPFTIDQDIYKRGGLVDYVPVVENPSLKDKAINVNQYLQLVRQKHPGLIIKAGIATQYMSLPSRKLYIPIDVNVVKAKDIVPDTMEHLITDKISLEVAQSGLQKADLMLLDLIAHHNWERPIYFTYTGLRSLSFDLRPYVVQEGLAYRLLPIFNSHDSQIPVNTDVMLANMMEEFQWEGLSDSSVYYNDYYKDQLINPRVAFNRLASSLIEEKRIKEALEVIDRNLYVIPDDTIPYDLASLQTGELLAKLNQKERAHKIVDTIAQRVNDDLDYYLTSSAEAHEEIRRRLSLLNYCVQISEKFFDTATTGSYRKGLSQHLERYKQAG